jgi:ATP-binding cassette, subfamily B, multidrug efflux pump
MKETIRNFRPLKVYFVRNKWILAIGMVSLLVVDLLQLLIPLVIRKAIDSLTIKTATSIMLLRYGAVILAIALTMALLRYVWRHCLFGLSRKIEEGVRNQLYTHLQTLSLSYYHRTRTGDLMARAINDINAVRMATGMGLVALTDGLVLGIAAVGFMLYINYYLTLISIIPAPVLIYFTRILTRRMSTGYEKVQAVFSDLTERAREAFAGIRVVKAYARETWTYGKMEREGARYISENMRLAKSISLFLPLMTIFTDLGLAIVIWLGGRLTILGHITTGDFVAFISYLNLLTWPMMAIGWVANLIQRGSASMRRLNRVLDEVPEIRDEVPEILDEVPEIRDEVPEIRDEVPEIRDEIPEIRDKSTLPVPVKVKREIEFRNVNLKYPNATSEAIKGATLTIGAGQTVALAGRVGSGKTSLLHLLPRLYETPRGTIFIDGVDIRDIPLSALRESIGFVTQEVIIFSDTIRNNVLFGRRGISEEILKSALKRAEIYEEVMALDKGLDTLLGERGITLSGGQRQRLTIARAILLDPPILIMDDALSMVDTRTEERILNQILESRKGKTNLIVSHRLPTISRADLIVVLEKGELVEIGDHTTLMAAGREYAKLYERQMLAQELEINEVRNSKYETRNNTE